VAVTYADPTVRVFFDGVESGSSDVGTLDTSGFGLQLLTHPDNPNAAYTFKGDVDEAAIYPTALPGAEIAAHFDAAGGCRDAAGKFATVMETLRESVRADLGFVALAFRDTMNESAIDELEALNYTRGFESGAEIMGTSLFNLGIGALPYGGYASAALGVLNEYQTSIDVQKANATTEATYSYRDRHVEQVRDLIVDRMFASALDNTAAEAVAQMAWFYMIQKTGRCPFEDSRTADSAQLELFDYYTLEMFMPGLQQTGANRKPSVITEAMTKSVTDFAKYAEQWMTKGLVVRLGELKQNELLTSGDEPESFAWHLSYHFPTETNEVHGCPLVSATCGMPARGVLSAQELGPEVDLSATGYRRMSSSFRIPWDQNNPPTPAYASEAFAKLDSMMLDAAGWTRFSHPLSFDPSTVLSRNHLTRAVWSDQGAGLVGALLSLRRFSDDLDMRCSSDTYRFYYPDSGVDFEYLTASGSGQDNDPGYSEVVPLYVACANKPITPSLGADLLDPSYRYVN
jgi:hypothetical protein